MLTVPGSFIWLFLLVYLALGQISDISPSDTSESAIDEFEGAVNYTIIQHNEEEKENATIQLETFEKGESPDPDPSELLINVTAEPKPRNLSEKPQEFDGFDSWRNKRRRTTQRTVTHANVTEIPVMSQERRNSYLSIAERRKYYNRTRVQTTKKPDILDVELEYQETTNKLIISSTTEASLQTNEIRVSKKPIVKDSRVVTDRKNETINQRPSNETQTKPQSLRQSVIQSQYQFGQKLNLRKPVARPQEDEWTKKKKEKSKMESVMENSTNKQNRNYPTQSTKLLKVEKNVWATTTIPDSDVENFVMHQNETDVKKLAEYVTVNNSQPEILVNNIVSASGIDNGVTETKVPQSEINTFVPLSVEFENTTEENTSREDIQNVYNQEIFKLTEATTDPDSSEEVLPTTTPKSTKPTTEIIKTTTTTIKPSTEIKVVPAVAPSGVRIGKFSHHRSNATILKTNLKGLATTLSITTTTTTTTTASPSTTPVVRVIPKEEAINSSEVVSKSKIPQIESKVPQSDSKNWSNAGEYPFTIEVNENNLRVLGDMLQTTPETVKLDKEKPTTGTSVSPPPTNSTTTETTTTTTTSTTTEKFQPLPPDDFPEDHKAQGTQYRTKFYLSPHHNRSHVIKVIENDDVEENEVAAAGPTSGVAIYVLAAFGLVPLLLALAFGAKIMVQRRQRQYECESDAKSDISTSESQPRPNKKKKGGTDLKKSPSNVTTTTLVTTTRLPRVQHWENCDKQGNKNWEFPRSKLKLKTILGQGNFGQVWKAEAEDMGGHEGVSRLVAVKTVKEGATEKEHSEFIKELEIMQQIGSHPNIVTLLGCCTDQEPYYLIMEYVKYGKLLTYLREHRINENYYNFSSNSDALTSRDLTVFAYCVARGMEYLASRGIIHRDLAARNVLVDHTKLCKIADFGMSRSVRDFEDGQVYEERQHRGALPIRWMAPESLVYSVFTYKSDVWSFGIVMWEIVTLGSTPYPNMGAREVMRKVRDGYRLERPSHCKPEFFRLISHCWAHDPNKRPDFSELRHELSNLLDNPTKDGSYVDLDRFAVDNNFHIPGKTNDMRMLERSDFKSLKRLGDWNNQDWPEDGKRGRMKKGRNNGKGTVTLTGQGSFTVNSRILEKEFKMI